MSPAVYSTGQRTAGTVTGTTGAGTVPWTASGASLQADVATSDDVRASAALALGQETNQLKCQNFGFGVPDRAAIVGVIVRIERSCSVADSCRDVAVRLVVSGALAGDN